MNNNSHADVTHKTQLYDFIGIGIGPFNLGLAALTHETNQLSSLFLEKNKKFDWHPGLMFNDATLQVPFLADLVTMANPCSKFSFLNYLKENNRLYKFYIREDFFVLRKEYNKYCQWVVQQLENCLFDQEVIEIVFNEEDHFYKIITKEYTANHYHTYYTKKLVLGIGAKPYVPPCVDLLNSASICHASEFLNYKKDFLQQESVTIVGSGQSAAEIFYDLLQCPNFKELNWLTRADRFYAMEYSKLTLELTSPEYVDHFYHLPQQARDRIIKNQNSLYKGINYDLINSIHEYIYQNTIDGNESIAKMYPCSELIATERLPNNQIKLTLLHTQLEEYFTIETDGLILATGYKYTIPSFIKNIKSRIAWNTNGKYEVNRNYTIDLFANEIFVQNAELHTHGFVTPDLGMGAYRNSIILNEILGYEYYKVEKRVAFQSFAATPQISNEYLAGKE